jgi:hypothetical protein
MTELGRKFDQEKLRYDLLPPHELEEIVKVLTHGARKYADNNWQVVDNARKRYEAALFRHFQLWRKGEQIDPDTGDDKLFHMAQVAINAIFLLWLDREGIK